MKLCQIGENPSPRTPLGIFRFGQDACLPLGKTLPFVRTLAMRSGMKVKLLPVLLLAGILAGVAVGTTGCVAVGAALADDALSKDDRKEFQK